MWGSGDRAHIYSIQIIYIHALNIGMKYMFHILFCAFGLYP